MFAVNNLRVDIKGKEILKGVSLKVKQGEIHFLMGPNGAGKTSLALSLMGNPKYKVKNIKSKVKIDGQDLLILKPEERARKGLFIGFQYPVDIEGISVFSLLRNGYNSLSSKKISLKEFKSKVKNIFKKILIQEDFLERPLSGFSGGEKKRLEIVQLLLFKPKFAILDEIDSGLDIDGLKAVSKAIKTAVEKHKTGIIFITHYPRIYRYLKPDFVHIIKRGKIVRTDGVSLIKKIEKEGYATIN